MSASFLQMFPSYSECSLPSQKEEGITSLLEHCSSPKVHLSSSRTVFPLHGIGQREEWIKARCMKVLLAPPYSIGGGWRAPAMYIFVNLRCDLFNLLFSAMGLIFQGLGKKNNQGKSHSVPSLYISRTTWNSSQNYTEARGLDSHSKGWASECRFSDMYVL